MLSDRKSSQLSSLQSMWQNLAFNGLKLLSHKLDMLGFINLLKTDCDDKDCIRAAILLLDDSPFMNSCILGLEMISTTIILSHS